jgi:hypothetical protein
MQTRARKALERGGGREKKLNNHMKSCKFEFGLRQQGVETIKEKGCAADLLIGLGVPTALIAPASLRFVQTVPRKYEENHAAK